MVNEDANAANDALMLRILPTSPAFSTSSAAPRILGPLSGPSNGRLV